MWRVRGAVPSCPVYAVRVGVSAGRNHTWAGIEVGVEVGTAYFRLHCQRARYSMVNAPGMGSGCKGKIGWRARASYARSEGAGLLRYDVGVM